MLDKIERFFEIQKEVEAVQHDMALMEENLTAEKLCDDFAIQWPRDFLEEAKAKYKSDTAQKLAALQCEIEGL